VAKHVLLDNVNHKDLKIITERSAKYGDQIPSILTFPFEFRDILTHYPICFSKDPETGQFHCVALLGFEDKENLFLNEDGWDASYIPLMIERQPFLIGFQEQEQSATSQRQRVVHVDLDSPRVSATQGKSVFLEHGGSTAYLQRISSILEAIYKGQEITQTFFNVLLKYELIEPFTLDVKLNDGTDNKLKGFYTINEDNLKALSTDVQSTLMEAGFLESIYMVIASFSNFRALIQRKNQQCVVKT
jgi:hypothetical protein